jgi:hypothetical protein
MPETLHTILNKSDESFDPARVPGCDLLFEAGERTFGYSIRDAERNRFVALGYFRNPAADVVKAFPWLAGPFRKTSGIIANTRFTLIPEALFAENEKDHYFNFLHEREPGDAVASDRLEHLGLFSVYGISGTMNKELDQAFPGATLNHVSTVLIRNIWMHVKNRPGSRVFLNLREGQFDLLAFEGNQLKYCNAFHFLTAEDIAYYIIFVFEQLNLNPEEINLSLLGNIDKFSPVFELLFRYIRNIDFLGRKEDSGYSYFFNDVPAHLYYTLLTAVS